MAKIGTIINYISLLGVTRGVIEKGKSLMIATCYQRRLSPTDLVTGRNCLCVLSWKNADDAT